MSVDTVTGPVKLELLQGNLDPTKNYYFRIRAQNSAGWSLYTDISTGMVVATEAPAFTQQPSQEYNVNPGDVVRLEATGSGRPTPEYVWYYSEDKETALNFDSAISEGAKWSTVRSSLDSSGNTWDLVIDNIGSGASGFYWCVATNDAGIAIGQITELVVNIPPTIVKDLSISSRSINPGSTQILSIEASGTPLPQVKWYVGAVRLLVLSVNR